MVEASKRQPAPRIEVEGASDPAMGEGKGESFPMLVPATLMMRRGRDGDDDGDGNWDEKGEYGNATMRTGRGRTEIIQLENSVVRAGEIHFV